MVDERLPVFSPVEPFTGEVGDDDDDEVLMCRLAPRNLLMLNLLYDILALSLCSFCYRLYVVEWKRKRNAYSEWNASRSSLY